jgi:2-dehydro-3-deoxy-L-rhamnonate dehydrogenase (NAD+)
MNHYDLKDQVAVVTGGAQGIGLAVARRLVASGARVALWDRDVALATSAAAALGEAAAFACDVTDEASVAAALAATNARFGRVDILVANAGITGPNLKVWDYPLAEWERVFAVNTRGVFLANKAVVPGMMARGYGRIVNIASVAGKEGNPNASAYSASKAAVIALTKSLGKELAGHDIAVNCVTPAAAKTAIFDQMTHEHIQMMLSKIPKGRFVEVDEIAAMVVFMCSRECSFTTAGVFDITGGRATY